ncbi:glycerophosphoryl diester phosphodiesterase [Cryobacterium sp. MP_M5]|uniref:glycerophosphodiester phosphodiesterase family protein n=1 Tax=unclassified Cryobacterium TaxID=2649013 RepID=UPI0018C9EB39|nr:MULTISPECIES: glycerophosphodiester phosphodiesterase family protein [unclassified Cryobacterium]MBG6059237.1 glycerophosphoryl diester phosphodiesterase [Cryobacterium sp. MP_M3]MEC5177531.1 glycerophosphoryl diester phosphodiesterase [Cryobacterium sp. MP_M5]
MRSILLSTAVTAALSAALVATTLATPALAAESHPEDDGHGADRHSSFDLQAHRGGRGEWTEESTAAFARSLELGVTTLELDTHLTRDDQVVVWHDDIMTAAKCADTAPAFAGDPAFPYADDRVRDLTLAQIRTMDCGFQQLPGFPTQTVIAGNRIALLQDVFALVDEYDARKVRLNVETKVEVAGPDGADEMEALTRSVVGEIEGSGLAGRTTLQSFDWASLNLTREIAPDLPLVALSSGDVWLGVGAPGMSPNLAGIDIDTYNGSLAQAAAAQGYDVISPNLASATPAMITEAHSLGLPVIPWTVNEPADVSTLMDEGVDGIITDYPSRVRQIMADRGLALPRPYTR